LGATPSLAPAFRRGRRAGRLSAVVFTAVGTVLH
jgi:hypothetical protein